MRKVYVYVTAEYMCMSQNPRNFKNFLKLLKQRFI